MNKKLVVKNTFGKIVYCVLSDTEPYKKQLLDVLSIHEGCGRTIDFKDEKLRVIDYYSNEALGVFEVISFTDTQEDVVLYWVPQQDI